MVSPSQELAIAATAAAVLGATALIFVAKSKAAKAPVGLLPLSAAPRAPRAPILGNLKDLRRRDVHRVLTAWAEEYGPVYTIQLLSRTILVVTDMDLAGRLLKGPSELLKFDAAYAGARQSTSPGKTPGIFSLTAEADLPWHHAMRKAVASSFSIKHLTTVYPKIRQHAADLAAKLASISGPQEVDITSYVMAGSLDSAMDTNYDMQSHALDDPPNNKFVQGMKGALEELSKRVIDPLREPLQSLLWFLPGNRRILAQHEDAYAVYRHIVDTLKSRGAPTDEDQSIGANILRARDHTGSPLEGDRLISVVSTMLLAAIDTSASCILWALYNIARNPGVHVRLEQELKEAGLITRDGTPGRLPEWSDLTSLTYFNMVMKESTRLHNIAGNTATFRVTSKAQQIGPYWVPKGIPIWVPLYCVANASHNFPNPTEFIPERWAESKNTAGRVNTDSDNKEAGVGVAASGAVGSGGVTHDHDWTSLVFSQGSRGCVGLNQGLVQVRTTLLMLLSRLRFSLGPTLADHNRVEENQEMVLTMVSGLGYPFVISPR